MTSIIVFGYRDVAVTVVRSAVVTVCSRAVFQKLHNNSSVHLDCSDKFVVPLCSCLFDWVDVAAQNYDYLDWDECTLVCVSCHCQRALVSLFIVIQNFTTSFFVGLLMM